MNLLRNFIPRFEAEEAGHGETVPRYRRLWESSVLLVSLVSLVPLVVMTVVNYMEYQKVFHTEMLQPIANLTSNTKRSLESFIAERRSALTFIVAEKTFEELCDVEELKTTFSNLKKSFGGFVDLGVIDKEGKQRSYVGPYDLLGKNYTQQTWFHEVCLRDVFVSDVFEGYRGFPHFVIAVKHEENQGEFYILRATFDTEILSQRLQALELHPSSDAFVVNKEGVLQTQSRYYGKIFEKIPIAPPYYSSQAEVVEQEDPKGELLAIGYGYIERSPFILMIVERPKDIMKNWLTLRNRLIWFLVISVLVLLLVILWGSTYMVNRIRQADMRRAQMLHQIQYTSKMATIGRLAAGVAHEINNPLAIINENAGLLVDLTSLSDDFPNKQRVLRCVTAVIKSVERCSTITHRLLGFGKRMDTKTETIDLSPLIKEVLGFLEKEASYRSITIEFHIDGDVPTIESDRGQLQQVFLNIVNNAFEAVDKGGRLDISIARAEPDGVEVTVCDNGDGIPEENLQQIFDPFFTTKKEYGTGLGLSITYGIVEKLGGKISVQSRVGEGTCFTVVLPRRGEVT